MIVFGTILPLLFASPSLRDFSQTTTPTNQTPLKSTTASSERTTSLRVSSLIESSSTKSTHGDVEDNHHGSKGVGKILEDTKELYADLSIDRSACVQNYTPTLSLSYVSPPSSSLHEKDDGFLLQQQLSSCTTRIAAYSTIAATHDSTKTLALYLPGLDGVGVSATAQFPSLSETFELWRLVVDRKNDRSSFTELTNAVAEFICDVTGADSEQGRELVLIGESFGGLLAPAVALRIRAIYEKKRQMMGAEVEGEPRNPIMGMVLVNPATSFDDTAWGTLGPLLASLRHLERKEVGEEIDEPPSLPTPYSVIGGMALSALVPDRSQFQKIFSLINSVDIKSVDDATELLKTMRDGFGILADNLPAEVVEHRVAKWLPVGTAVVNPRLDGLDVPTLVVAGEEDNFLPTKKEATRLAKTMPNCTVYSVKGTGHFVLDDRLNLTQTILNSAPFRAISTLPPRRGDTAYDPILDWRLPPPDVIRETIDGRVKVLRTMTGPKFFSTDEEGRRFAGLGEIPGTGDGPLLFVANHQFLGLDLGLIIAELIEERGMIARGLAHPVVFGAGGGNFGGDGVEAGRGRSRNQNDGFQEFGAVMVTPRNYYRLMATNQNALLFPGGVREVFHNREDAYKLLWPDDIDPSKSDFVRTAAKFNATIIPLSAIGGADSAYTIVQSRDVKDLPFGLGERAIKSTRNITAARFDQENDEEPFTPPLAVPKPLAARHYFVFGKPFRTDNLDSNDRDGCQRVYKEVKREVERGLMDLLKAREKDPFGNTAKRVAYESVSGKKAPTFPIEELNVR